MLFTIAATIGKIGIGLGANTIAMAAIKAITPAATSTVTKVCLKAGGIFLGAAAAGAAMKEYDQTIETFRTIGKTIKTRIHEKMETVKEAE